MARINIDSVFFGDKRVDRLAKLCNEISVTVRGRLLQIWFHCYEQRSSILTAQEVDLHAEWLGEGSFAELMVQAHLAIPEESHTALKEYRICGVEDRIDYLVKSSENGKKSAEARRKKYGSSKPGIKNEDKNSEGSQKVVRRVPEGCRKVTEPLPLPLPLPPSLSLALDIPPEGVSAEGPAQTHEKPKRNTIAIERSLEKRAVAVADQIMGVFREVSADEVAAQERLPDWIWAMIVNRWRKWEAFCIEVSNAFQSGKATFFQHQLRQSVTAALLLAVDNRAKEGA